MSVTCLLRVGSAPASLELQQTAHVEAKVAAEVVQSGQRRTELVLNSRPSVGPLGCDSLPPVLLPKDDAGNVVIRVTTAAEPDAPVDRIIEETAEHTAPPMIQVAFPGVKRSPALDVALGKEKGFIGYTSRTEGGWTVGGDDANTMVDYIYTGVTTAKCRPSLKSRYLPCATGCMSSWWLGAASCS
ncbi:Imm1 family immunity protein [Amycolatopsis sp. NPDC005961]|uniref:Imm1 family immunity protein n=1 Tax=Amycolatopsis sp. NPDC005961 TaxID=3156720 RepID=UPI0033CD5564